MDPSAPNSPAANPQNFAASICQVTMRQSGGFQFATSSLWSLCFRTVSTVRTYNTAKMLDLWCVYGECRRHFWEFRDEVSGSLDLHGVQHVLPIGSKTPYVRDSSWGARGPLVGCMCPLVALESFKGCEAILTKELGKALVTGSYSWEGFGFQSLLNGIIYQDADLT